MTELDVPQWYYELTDRAKATGIGYLQKPMKVQRPSLFGDAQRPLAKDKDADEDALKIKRAWEVALSPAKSLPMNLVMSYFSGNSLQMVTVTMTAYMFFMSPLRQILGVQETFRQLDGPKIHGDILMTKVVYVACSLIMVAAGIWKVGQMGLLPTHQSDWLAWEALPRYLPCVRVFDFQI